MQNLQPQRVRPTEKLRLGCPILTRFLSGGIPCSTITELVGESGVGKTQLCLQLSVATASPGSSSSLYLHSESPFPLRRLHSLSLPHPGSLSRVLVRAVHSADDLLAVLDRLPAFLRSQSPPVRLLVVDSIAALFRAEFDNTGKDMRRRSDLFFRIAAGLKEIADRFRVAVVVTNQVVDVVYDGDDVRVGNYGLLSDRTRLCPALGLSWASCVNVRLFLAKTEQEQEQGGRIRKMLIVFAPHLPEGSCDFVVDKDGVFGVPRKTSGLPTMGFMDLRKQEY